MVVKSRILCAVAVVVLGASTIAGLAPPASATLAPGPDSHGYTVSAQPYAWTDIIGQPGTVSVPMPWYYMYTSPLPIGFTFNFYGSDETSVYGHPFGFLSFDYGCYFCYYNQPGFPYAYTYSAAGGVIAPYAAYFDGGGYGCPGQMHHQTSGSAPNRVFTLQWTGLTDYYSCYYPGSYSSSTFQVKLHETTNRIEIVIQKAGAYYAGWYGAATGIESGNQCSGLTHWSGYSYATPNLSNLRLQFVPPPTTADYVTINEDSGAKTIDVLANEGKPGATLSSVTWGAKGMASVASNKVAYTPFANQNTDGVADDAITYTYYHGGCYHTGKAYIKIQGINDKPTFSAASVSSPEDAGPATVSPVTTFSVGPFESAQMPTFSMTTSLVIPADLFDAPPTINPANGKVSFTAKPDRCGTAQLALALKDDGGTANGGQDTATPANVQLTVACVADPPVAVADTYYPLVDPAATPPAIKLLVLANDRDPDAGDAITIQSVTQPTLGSVSIVDAGGALLYTPPATGTGEATMTYVIRDKTLKTASAPVLVDVACTGVRAFGDAYGTLEDTTLTVDAPLGLKSNDDAGGATAIEVVQPPRRGAVTVAQDGAFVYVPHRDASGEDSFTYRLRDGAWCQDEATVRIDIVEQPDGPAAANDRFTVIEDSRDNELWVLGNDEPGAILVGVSAPTAGKAKADNGRVLYTPAPDFHGVDRFETFVHNGLGLSIAAVEVEVRNTPDVPLGEGDAYTLAADQGSTVVPMYGVLRNDLSPDGSGLQAQIVGPATHGDLVLRRDGGFSYTPHPGFRGTDGFSYRPEDATGIGAPVAVHLEVREASDPVADFRTAPATPVALIPVRFEDLSRDEDGVQHRQWWFGDGNQSLERDPVHTYARPGMYDVVLRVTDAQGHIGQVRRTVAVANETALDEGGAYAGQRPVADAGEDREAIEGTFVQLDGTAGDGERALAFAWRQVEGPDVGLQGADTGRPTFTAPLVGAGQDAVRLGFELTIYDGHYASAPAVVEVAVRPRLGEAAADAGADRTVAQGDTVVLSGAWSGFRRGDAVAGSWTQTGGQAVEPTGGSEGGVLGFIAASPGELRFRFTASSTAQEASDEVVVTVLGAGARNGFVAEPDGLSARFVALVPGAPRWSFGDGAYSREAEPTHDYARPGTYLVRLEVDGADGLQSYEQAVQVGLGGSAGSKQAPSLGMAGLGLALAALAVLALARARAHGPAAGSRQA